MSLIVRFLGSLLGLWLADFWLAGFAVTGGWKGFLIAALVLTILNLIIRPILKVISFPLILLTLGLFTLVINAVILWLARELTSYILIDNLVTLLWATIIITIVGAIFHWFKK